ncbi:hypothetical protein CLAIMM_15196 isoform 2 [Cladophialophora immunda]|nr:hypothetical protein CLAIMM_15196 isoform 2 [Cladophialophora immunda]
MDEGQQSSIASTGRGIRDGVRSGLCLIRPAFLRETKKRQATRDCAGKASESEASSKPSISHIDIHIQHGACLASNEGCRGVILPIFGNVSMISPLLSNRQACSSKQRSVHK